MEAVWQELDLPSAVGALEDFFDVQVRSGLPPPTHTHQNILVLFHAVGECVLHQANCFFGGS